MAKGRIQSGDFSKVILLELIDHAELKNLENEPYLGVGNMLTRISYQALGMVDQLPAPVNATYSVVQGIQNNPRKAIASRRTSVGGTTYEDEEEEEGENEDSRKDLEKLMLLSNQQ